MYVTEQSVFTSHDGAYSAVGLVRWHVPVEARRKGPVTLPIGTFLRVRVAAGGTKSKVVASFAAV